MKLTGKKIAFGLTDVFYTFNNTIIEMQNIIKEGGEVIPIMPIDTYKTDSKYYKSCDFIKDIEKIANRRIINSREEAENVEADVLVIAPCSRRSYN